VANNIVTKETYKGYTTGAKLDTVYDILAGDDGVLHRLTRLERRGLVDRGVAGVFGFLGGAAVMIGKLAIWR